MGYSYFNPLLLCLTAALVERDGLTRLIVGNPSALDTLSGVGLLVLLLTTLAAMVSVALSS